MVGRRMMRLQIIFLCLFMLSSSCVKANVAVPYPGEIYENQPDGTVATLRLAGHPYRGVFQTDSLGHPVLRDENGWYVYATYDNPSSLSNQDGKRQLRPSNRKVGIDMPPSHPPPDLTTLEMMTRTRRDTEVHDSNAPPMDSTLGNLTAIRARLNDMNCQGMDRSPWCPHRPVSILNLGRSAIIQGDQWGGVLNVIVILVKFSDQADRPVADVSQFNTLFNGDGFDDAIIPTGSVKRFYRIQSGGKLEVNAFVEDWIVAPETEEFYSFGMNGLNANITHVANGALDRMDARGTDWSFFDRDKDGTLDAIFIIHSGFAAEVGGTDGFTNKAFGPHRIWSHRASVGSDDAWHSKDGLMRVELYACTSAYFGTTGQDMTRVGVVGHEMGHMFGVPDLMASNGYGTGNYDCMGNMWGQDRTQYYPGLMGAWSRLTIGWLTPTILDQPGRYSLRAAVDFPEAYKITHGFPDGEYLLIENRVPREYDGMLDDHGIIIWHIDENSSNDWQQNPGWPDQVGWPGNNNHYQVAVLQADGLYELELGVNLGNLGDLWKSGMSLEPGPASNVATAGANYPNTDSYAAGVAKRTGVRLSGFSDPGDIMSFDMAIDGMPFPTSVLTPGPTFDSAATPTTIPTLPLTPPPTVAELTEPPTLYPTTFPTPRPTPLPSANPTPVPSSSPTRIPTLLPTPLPSFEPTEAPTRVPTRVPTRRPTALPTVEPTEAPSRPPSKLPTPRPTPFPTAKPTEDPSRPPSKLPTPRPTPFPTVEPTEASSRPPSKLPTPRPTPFPTVEPTEAPSRPPLKLPTPRPTPFPTVEPTEAPSRPPSKLPTPRPTPFPTAEPTEAPSRSPTPRPSRLPTVEPTEAPTSAPSRVPTRRPTPLPTVEPTEVPTSLPTSRPTHMPTVEPTRTPTRVPTRLPTPLPTAEPTEAPSRPPTPRPTPLPAVDPTATPTTSPSRMPTPRPTPFRAPITLSTPVPTDGPDTAPNGTTTPTSTRRSSPSPTIAVVADHPQDPKTLSNAPASQIPVARIPVVLDTRGGVVVDASILSEQPTENPSSSPTSSPSISGPSELVGSNPASTPTSSAIALQPAFAWINLLGSPTSDPTSEPTTSPTAGPTTSPTTAPTSSPSEGPTVSVPPSTVPTSTPSMGPSPEPSAVPSETLQPSVSPSSTAIPSVVPTESPSVAPTASPSAVPSVSPSRSSSPSLMPTSPPSMSLSPSLIPTSPPSLSLSPTTMPSRSHHPSVAPSAFPSRNPSHKPTSSPSFVPSEEPTGLPSISLEPSPAPSASPSLRPSFSPSLKPSVAPTLPPSESKSPSADPSPMPTVSPSLRRSDVPSLGPSQSPTKVPLVSSHIEPSKVPPAILLSSASAASEPAAGVSPSKARPASAPHDFPSLVSLEESHNEESGKSVYDFLSTATVAPSSSTTWKSKGRRFWYQLYSILKGNKKTDDD